MNERLAPSPYRGAYQFIQIPLHAATRKHFAGHEMGMVDHLPAVFKTIRPNPPWIGAMNYTLVMK